MKILRKVAMAISAFLDVQMPGASLIMMRKTLGKTLAESGAEIMSILGHDTIVHAEL